MGVETEKYVRKPLYVDAIRVTDQNFDEVAAWCQGAVKTDETSGKKFIEVRVHIPRNPRQTQAYVGDWVLWNERGYKVYTNKAFRSSFDQASTDNGNATNAPTAIADVQIHSVGPVAADPSPENGVQPIQAVSEVNDTWTSAGETEDTPTSPLPVEANGKRVLSEEEQRQMGPDSVRDLIGTGEVVLAQDLARQ